jgi:hypothetical protein
MRKLRENMCRVADKHPDSANTGKSTQSKSSRETNVQGKHPEETGKTLIKRERGSDETVLDHRLKQRCNRC